MTTHVKCDSCGKVVPKPGKMPIGWRTSAKYVARGDRNVFAGMLHACAACPMDVSRPGPEDLPILTINQALLEVEEAARFAALDDDGLRGSARRMVVRALAMLDAARDRIAGG